MIEKEVRKAPSGVITTIYQNENYKLRFTGFEDIPTPGFIEHRIEVLYAPSAMVNCDKVDGWTMLMTMPKMHIHPDIWPRLKKATEDIISFWDEVKEQL